MSTLTKEPQYQFEVELARDHGFARFGYMSNQSWREDPRRLLFLLSRYKFVGKLLKGKKRVLEVGCADAFATRLVQQEGCQVTAVDFDPLFVQDAQDRLRGDPWACEFRVHDILNGPVAGEFEAAYSLDVFEHIPSSEEHRFVRNIAMSVVKNGVVIFGSPSLQSQAYASRASREGHVNCKDGLELKQVMEQHFDHAFLFSMNDEVVHTGFHPLAHYLFTVCVGRKY